MRTEAALIVAETAGIVVCLGLSTLGDGRAQYGAGLILASLPAFYLIATILFIPNFWVLQKFKCHSHKNYLLLGVMWATALAFPIISVGGFVAGLSFGVAIIVTFYLFSLLVGERKI